jgi:hypothetical protein
MSQHAAGAHRNTTQDGRLNRQARPAAKSARNSAIKRAEAELALLTPRIVDHIKHESLRLEAALLAARVHDSNYRSCVSEAYDAGQHLRDVADTIGYRLVGFIATNLCTIIETADDAGMDYPAAVLGCHLDALQLVQTAPYRDRQVADLPELSTALLQAVQYTKTLAARAARAPVTAP